MTLYRVCVVLIATALTACGGSSGKSGGGDLPPVRTSGTVAGVAHDAPLRNATVKVYDWTTGQRGALLAETQTDSDGNYDIQITTDDKPVMVTAGDNGSYVEEASGRSISLTEGQNISAITYYQSGETLSLQVTPFTHLARCYAEYLINDGESVADALNVANSKLASIAGVEIINTEPLDVTDIDNSTTELSPGLKYGFLTAGISEAMAVVSEANGQQPHGQSFLASIHWSKIACNDIKADGLLNGYGFTDSTTMGNLTFGTYSITPYFYRNILAQGVLTFAMSEYNQTGLEVSDVLTFANALSTNTDDVWNGEPAEEVDIQGPTISAQILEESYIGGTADLPFTVDDPIGVNQVVFYVNDALVSTQSASNTTLILDTTAYVDGEYIVKVVASDIIGNETESNFTYNILNSGPAINLTSEQIVGDAAYTASGTWVSAINLASITVNGTTATINPNGTWNANISLDNGSNEIEVIATDDINNSSVVTYDVGADFNDPLIDYWTQSVRYTTYEGDYGFCELGTFTSQADNPICIRADRVSLNGSEISTALITGDYFILRFEVQDSPGAGIYTDFEDLIVEYNYYKEGEMVVDWTTLTTGFKYTQPGTINGYYLLPVTTEYLGPDWFNTSTTDSHSVNVRVTDSVGRQSTRSYALEFDILIYNDQVTSSSNASTVFDKSFDARTTVDGSTVVNTVSVTNNSDRSFYLDYTATNDHSVDQAYETVVRENRVLERAEELWRIKNQAHSSWTEVGSIKQYLGGDWVDQYPAITDTGYRNVYQDVVEAPASTDWVSNANYPCPSSTSYSQTDNGVTTTLDYQGGIDNNIFGCLVVQAGSTSSVSSNFEHRFEYTVLYEDGYPRNSVSTNRVNIDITDYTVSVADSVTGNDLDAVNGYIQVQPGQTVEISKSVDMPLLQDFTDMEVADLATFTSYTPRSLDTEITWSIDESFEVNLYAAIGSSAKSYSFGSINDYTITRD